MSKAEIFTPPFTVTDYVGHFGKPKPTPNTRDKRIVYGEKVEAYWHRVLGADSTTPVHFVDFRMLGKIVDQPWWFREYKDMAEGFLNDYWNQPMTLKEFKVKDDFLHHGSATLGVSMRGPRNLLPYLLKIGIKQCKLFTLDDPFLNDKDRALFMTGFSRSLGFPEL